MKIKQGLSYFFLMIAILKLLHVFFVFLWMGSLLLLTRFLGYLPKETPSVQLRLAKICRRVYVLVDFPSMLLALTCGILLLFLKEINFKAGWFHMKMTFTLLLIACDLVCGWQLAKRGHKPSTATALPYQIFHGITALCFLAVLVSIYILKIRV